MVTSTRTDAVDFHNPTYPRLMVSKNDTVVLFTEPGKGAVVHTPNHFLGFFSEDWDMYDFTDFHGTITLGDK